MIRTFLFAVLLVPGLVAAQTKIYSWTDASGRQHHSDRPPVGMNIKPRHVNAPQPSSTPVSRADEPSQEEVADPQKIAQQIEQQRAKDCEVAQNNLRLLGDPNRQIVNQADPEAKPLDEAQRMRAKALAERQVKDFCSVR